MEKKDKKKDTRVRGPRKHYDIADRKAGRPAIAVRGYVEKANEIQAIPERVLDLKQVMYWIGLQATAEEIAGSFFMSVDALDEKLRKYLGYNFADLKKKYGGDELLSLRRNQFKMAKDNPTMSIWLGKNYLKQKDHELIQEAPNTQLINALLDQVKSLKGQLDDLRSNESSGKDNSQA